ncbi:MAG: tetratricopeptide repeat protein [Pseudolabrys sp.]
MAQDPAAQQQQLYDRMVRQPTNYNVTLEYVRLATDRNDYEAAIGALERLLYYNPSLGQVKYQLGTLYYRLRAFEMARRYFQEALASPDTDAGSRASIAGYLADMESQTKPSRFSGFAQVGLRYQTNGNFAPAGDIIRFGAQNLLLPTTSARRPDTNVFGLVALNHDWDLENQRGDVIETRFAGYLTDQFHFTDLNVALYELSIGPRMAIAPELLPGATIKPYLLGGQTWVGGATYQNSAGAGFVTQFPIGVNFTFGPTFEWRHVDFNLQETVPTSVFNSGDWYTTGLAASAALGPGARADARGFYRRGRASLAFQTFKQWIVETALTFDVTSPFVSVAQNVSISPYVRYIKTDFDTPDPFIDPAIARADDQWVFGTKIDMAFTKTFGLSATVQYDHTASSLPNYRQNNLSVLAGPTVRF